MPGKKRKRNQATVVEEVKVSCQNCGTVYDGNLHANGAVHSKFLTSHLKRRKDCRVFYSSNLLLKTGARQKLDFSTSVCAQDRVNNQQNTQHHCDSHFPFLPQYSARDFGLVSTPNCPSGTGNLESQISTLSNRIDHRTLNANTLFVGATPHVSRENIQAVLSRSSNPPANNNNEQTLTCSSNMSSTDDTSNCVHQFHVHPDGDDNNGDEQDEVILHDEQNFNHPAGCGVSVVGNLPSSFGAFSNSLTAEVELCHLLRT